MVTREQSMQVLPVSEGSDPKEYDEERLIQRTFDEIANVRAVHPWLSSPLSNRLAVCIAVGVPHGRIGAW